MHIVRSILLLMTGAASGFAFVLSCGDNLSAKADADAVVDAAPTCDCPAAEPPLAGRLVGQDVLDPLDGNSEGHNTIFCPEGARFISGSCTVLSPFPYHDVILRESGFVDNPQGWRCSYRNNGSTQILYRIAVLCLKPAP